MRSTLLKSFASLVGVLSVVAALLIAVPASAVAAPVPAMPHASADRASSAAVPTAAARVPATPVMTQKVTQKVTQSPSRALVGDAAPAGARLPQTAAAALANPSSAALSLPVPGPATSLDDALKHSLTAYLAALLCPISNAIADATQAVPGLGQLTSQLKTVVCALNIVGYAYRTTYYPASGPPVVRYYRAIAGVPALLDANGDHLPDFIGAVEPSLTLDGISLTVARVPLLGLPAGAKVKVEAVFLDPGAQNTYLGFGEDGTAAGAANNWKTTVTVYGLSSSATDLGLALKATNAPATLAAMGEVFTGTSADAPTTVDGGSIAFTPVPAVFTTEVRLTQDRQEALVSSPIPSKVDGHVNVIRPGDEKDVDVTADKLPATLDVVHTSHDGHETATSTTSAPIDSLSLAYHDRAGAQILTAAKLDATGVPAAITFDQVDGTTSIDAPSGAFGTVEARFATGGEVPDRGAGDAPYAAFHRFDTSKLTGGLRLKNLKSVTIDQTGPYTGELVFSAPLGSLPFSAQDDVSGIALTGDLSNLPLDTSVSIDPSGGVVTFDGHGTGIDEIAVHATKSNGTFFAKASRIDATVDGIPAQETIYFQQVDGSVQVMASDPPSTISLLASDGSDAPPVDGSAAWFEDTASRYRAFARISKLSSLVFGSSPDIAGSFDTGDPQVMTLHGEADGVTVDGVIDQLPAHVAFNVPDDRIHIDYTGDPIHHIGLTATGLPASAQFRNAKVDIYGISPVLDVYLGIDPSTRSATFVPLVQDCPQEGCDTCDPRIDDDCDGDGGDGGGGSTPPPPPPDPKLFGIDAHGHGVDQILVHAWADDADLPLHPDLTPIASAMFAPLVQDCPQEGCDTCDPQVDDDCGDGGDGGGGGGGGGHVTPPPFEDPTTTNAILYDGKTAGHEDLRARIVHLKHAFYTENSSPTGPDGYPVFNGTDNVDVEFTQPADLTLGIAKDGIHGTLTIPQVDGRTLPSSYVLDIGTQRVINAVFEPNAVIPKVEVSMAVGNDADGERKALISGTIENIPTQTNVCIAQGGSPDCRSFMLDSVKTGGASNEVIGPDIDFNINSNGPPVTEPGAMTVNARICLGDINSNAWVPAACEDDQTAEKYIDIKNLKVHNVDIEYADGVTSKYQGNFWDDDSMAAYLNTDGVLVDDFRYVKPDGKGVEFIKTDHPLTAQDFFIAVNYSISVRAGVMYKTGSLSCPPDTRLYLITRNDDGTVSRWGLPFTDSTNLWGLVNDVMSCD